MINSIFNLFKKRKKVITLKEFAAAIEKVAKDLGQTYYHVKIEYCPSGTMTTELGNVKGIVLGGYINGHGWHSATSIDDVVKKFKNPYPKDVSPIVDAELAI